MKLTKNNNKGVMAERLTLESALSALESLLRQIRKDIGYQHGERIREILKNFSDIDSDEEAEEEVESVDMETESRGNLSSEDSTSERDISDEETSCSSPQPGTKRTKKATKSSNKKKKIETPITKQLPPPPSPPTAPIKTTTTATPKPPTASLKTGMPPIFCFSGNVAEISRFAKGAKIEFKLKNLNTTKTIINTVTREGFEGIKNFLKTRKIQSHTFTPREDRKNMLMLKGIHHSYSAEEIMEELVHEGIPAIKVSVFKSPRSKGKIFNCFIVEINKEQDVNEVYKKTLLMNQKVHWERLQNKDVTQCRNCQRFGHIAINCGMPYVCVKCNEQHQPGECKRKESQGTEVYCANCKKNGHPASYKGCPSYKAKAADKEKLKAQKKVQQEFAAKSACTLTRPAISFAAMAKMGLAKQSPTNTQQTQVTTVPKKTTQQPAAKPTIKQQSQPAAKQQNQPKANVNLSDEVQRMFGSDLASVMMKARSAVPTNYATMNESSKSVALATFIFQLCNV